MSDPSCLKFSNPVENFNKSILEYNFSEYCIYSKVKYQILSRDIFNHSTSHFKVGHELDVILVHGISGRAFKSWKIFSDQPKTVNEYWPIHWLSQDFKNIRIISVGYESEFTKWRQKSPIKDFK
ncbi:hypothetical protein HZS_7007 [Henneguya salminicola]|nr:hypothetical protein HZS_7007 [Henneguya salminicola]